MGILPLFAAGVVVIVTSLSVALAVLKKLGVIGTQATPSDTEVAELRATVADMEIRMGELEERLDFAERVLAKHRDAERLAPPPQ